MFDPLWRLIGASRLVRPALVGAAGWIGVAVARHNALHAPSVIAGALVIAVAAVALRERGAALAAIGVAATSAFVAPTGLGPLLVAAGVAVAASPGSADPLLAPWADAIDALIALPALSGLATVVASEPSQRGIVVGVAAGVVALATRLRAPNVAKSRSAASILGVIAGASLAGAPQLWGQLGDLPRATLNCGRGVAAAVAVFGVVAVAQSARLPRPRPVARGQHAVSRGLRRPAR